ncbi:MAG: pfkB family carbohydrate kinase [Chloroflexota bacterium]|nr:pfkB family carbohydrate kinase [Chloroflexota bacterium]
MIVVVGRPGLARPQGAAEPPGVGGPSGVAGLTAAAGLAEAAPHSVALDGLAALVAVAAAHAGADVELVGSIGDDEDGDRVVVELGRSGVRHAALLRDPAGRTPAGEGTGPLPRLDAADIGLGLSYLSGVRVVILAEALPADARQTGVEAAAYHGASLIVLVAAGEAADDDVGDATVLEAPEGGRGPFAGMVGRYAAAIDRGAEPADALGEAARAAGWEHVTE